jgi:uncharacterized tellurite resistance protein B-like protein
MAFWDFFSNTSTASNGQNSIPTLKAKLDQLLPDAKEEDLMQLACIAGLLARIVYVDLKVHPGEISSMREILSHWTDMLEFELDAIVLLTLEDHKELAGLENQIYTQHIRNSLSVDKKYNLLECLFAIAASDGEASNEESEEVRSICKGLGLDHQHFVSARATVKDKLAALKKPE